MTRILIVAHAPLAQALRAGALHVFPEAQASIAAVDVSAHASREHTLADLKAAVAQLGDAPALVVTDIFGATPCNLAREALAGTPHALLAGANLPMLVRALTYSGEPLPGVVERALSGGAQGVMQVALPAPPAHAV